MRIFLPAVATKQWGSNKDVTTRSQYSIHIRTKFSWKARPVLSFALPVSGYKSRAFRANFGYELSFPFVWL